MSAPGRLKAPFPWFGGKSKVAGLVWERFGDVRHYVEPFFGSGAVLLGRPLPFDGIETINDADGYVANFWRAVRFAPDEVADWADWPVNETDLHARHYWLVTEGRERLSGLLGDPDGYDAKVAGWWCWGLSVWIGGGFCSGRGPWVWRDGMWRHRRDVVASAEACDAGVTKKLPHLGDSGKGVNAVSLAGISMRRCHLSGRGKGVNSGSVAGKRDAILLWMRRLSERMRNVRVVCGDWARVVTPAVLGAYRRSAVGVFLDPPYSHGERDGELYAVEGDIARDVARWAMDAGRDPSLRICLAGYEGEHDMPPDWTVVAWRAGGGYANFGTGRAKTNAWRERLWFSPGCLSGSDSAERLL